MIKRALLLLAGLGLVSLIAAPALVGVAVERAEPTALRLLSRRLPGVVVEQRLFRRGWFASESRWRAVRADGGQRVDLEVHYRHGPWFGATGWLDVTAILVPGAEGQSGRATARVSLLADVSGRLALDWPAQARLDLGYRYDRGTDALGLALDRVEAALGALELEGLRGTLSVRGARHAPPRVALSLAGDRLAIDGLLAADHPRLGFELDGDRRFLDLGLTLAAGRLAGYGEAWNDLDARVRLEQLHFHTLYAALAGARNRWRSGLRGPALVDQLRADATLTIPALLRRQPRLLLDGIEWRSDGEDAAFRGHLGFTAPPPAGFLADPVLLGRVLDLALAGRVPRPLLERWAPRLAGDSAPPDLPPEAAGEAFLTGLKANRIIETTASHYRIDLAYRDQQLSLNGQPMMLPTF